MDSFKVPALPSVKKKKLSKLREYEITDIVKGKLLGKGSFAEVYQVQVDGREFALKEFEVDEWDSFGKKNIKEASINADLPPCEYVCRIDGICYSPLSLMYDFCSFDFSVFSDADGNQEKRPVVTTLAQYLSYLDNISMENFEPLSVKCAEDIIKGVAFLHENRVAHRDIKPSNVLISNQHYAKLSPTEKRCAFAKCPIICKIADFGESSSEISQTKNLMKTKTKTFDVGTVPFMAPEILKGSKVASVGLLDMIRTDYWSLGMTLLLLCSPDMIYPFRTEYEEERRVHGSASIDFERFIQSTLLSGIMPSWSPKYMIVMWKFWDKIVKYYYSLCVLDPSKRTTLCHLDNAISSMKITTLAVSQDTAIIEYDKAYAANESPMYPENNGRNCCTFLSWQFLLSVSKVKEECERKIKEIAEDVIVNFPRLINPLRNSTDMYGVLEAKKILSSMDNKFASCDVNELLLLPAGVFSKVGFEDLMNGVQILVDREGYGIYTAGCYTFSIFSNGGKIFLLDTHTVPPTSGGSMEGCLLITEDTSASSILQICSWIAKRLAVTLTENPRHHHSLSEIVFNNDIDFSTASIMIKKKVKTDGGCSTEKCHEMGMKRSEQPFNVSHSLEDNIGSIQHGLPNGSFNPKT